VGDERNQKAHNHAHIQIYSLTDDKKILNF